MAKAYNKKPNSADQAIPSQKERTRRPSFFRFKNLKWVLIGILVIGIAFLLIAKPVFNIDLLEKMQKNRTQTGSVAILTKMEDLFLFQTVEYVYKTVFPYDYVSADYNWRGLLDREAAGEPLTEIQKENLAIYRFCDNIGINLLRKDYQFVVITTIVRGGFDLKGTPFNNPEEFTNIEEYISIDKNEQVLYLRLPPPVITGFEIEDLNSATYVYPDIDISPENWKRLTRFTAERIEQQVLEDGILDLALQRGKAFIEKILQDSGLQEIVFIEP